MRPVLCALLLACAHLAAAQAYPSKPLRMIVGYSAGGGADALARLVAGRMHEGLGQQVLVENRPGAGATIAAASVASAAPDGYTLFFADTALLIAPGIYQKLTFDPVKSFAPVSGAATTPLVVVVNPDVKAQNIGELIALAKASPGKLSYGSPGVGTVHHLAMETFKRQAAVEIVHVPYKGPAAALTDLLGGQVQIYFETAPLILPQVAAGKLRVIAVAAESRIAQMPDVPTTTESGFPELVGGFWSGILAPAGTPVKIVGKLNSAINETMQSPQVQDSLTKLAGHARVGSPDEFAAFIAAERQKWTPIAARVKAN